MNRPIKNATGKLVCVLLTVAGFSSASHATLLWEANFNDGQYSNKLSSEPCGDKNTGCGCADNQSLTVTNVGTREGAYAGLAILSKCHERAEFREKSYNQPAIGADRYYGYSLKPSANFDTTRWTIIQQMAQWYSGVPDWANTGAWHFLGIENGNWSYRIKYSDGSPQNVKIITYNLGPVQRNAWTDFVVNGVWRADSGGKFQVWVRQPGGLYVKKAYREGSVILDVPKAPYFKIGLYRGDPNWTGVNNFDSISIDRIKVGTAWNDVQG